jgi:hypothetical protein
MRNVWLTGGLLALAAALAGCGDGAAGNFFGSSSAEATGEYSILLYIFTDPETRFTDSKQYKENTEKATGWKGLFVVHEEERSILYMGRYRTLDEARSDLKKVKAFRTPVGVPLYAKAIVMALPGKDVGPPEWNLENARGAYSLCVATFQDAPEEKYFGRKQFAVDYCKQLRDKGVEAYYRHGEMQSAVTVGAFPESSVQMVKEVQPGKGYVERPILGSDIQQMMRKFPYTAVNGRQEITKFKNPQTEQVVKQITPSQVVKIPEKKGTPASQPQAPAPSKPSRSLRSLGIP